jgi:hypothetical protein
LNTEPSFIYADNPDGGKFSVDVAGRYPKFVPVTPHFRPILAGGAHGLVLRPV